MLDKPDLSDEAISACLRDRYEVTGASIAFLPLGFDIDAWVYRVDAEGGRQYFLKLKQAPAHDLTVAVAHALKIQAIEQIVAPLPALTGALASKLGDVTLVLYPFIDGRAGWDVGLTPSQWAAFGAILRRIHAASLPVALTDLLPREDFVPSPRWSQVVGDILAAPPTAGDEWTTELSAFVAARREALQLLLRRAETLGRWLQHRHGPFVLCHADIHVGNVMVDGDGELWIVDWDQPILAPIERDLMFVLGTHLRGVAPDSPEEAAFFAGYGAREPDPVALTYYRYDWAIQDIGSSAHALSARPDLGNASKQASLRILQSVFDPGGIADAALRSDALLPPDLQGSGE